MSSFTVTIGRVMTSATVVRCASRGLHGAEEELQPARPVSAGATRVATQQVTFLNHAGKVTVVVQHRQTATPKIMTSAACISSSLADRMPVSGGQSALREWAKDKSQCGNGFDAAQPFGQLHA